MYSPCQVLIFFPADNNSYMGQNNLGSARKHLRGSTQGILHQTLLRDTMFQGDGDPRRFRGARGASPTAGVEVVYKLERGGLHGCQDQVVGTRLVPLLQTHFQ